MLSAPSLERRLAAAAPELVEACRPELAAAATFARQAERGESYNVSDGRFALGRLRRRLVESAMESRTVYVTSDLFRRPMLRGIHLITEGLVARLARRDTLRVLPPLELDGPGVTPATARDTRERNIVNEYGIMLRNRASYLDLHDRGEEAAALRERAARLLR